MMDWRDGGVMSYHGGHGGRMAADGAGGLIWIAVMLAIILFFLLAKAAWIVVKALSQVERNRAVWIAFFLWLGSGLLLVFVAFALSAQAGVHASLTAQAQDVLGTLGVAFAVISVLLVMVARSVVAQNQQLFSRPKEALTTSVLQRSWWPSVTEIG